MPHSAIVAETADTGLTLLPVSNPYGNDPYGQQPPQNPYGAPAPAGGFQEQPKTDGVSIAALVSSLLCCAPVAVILGFVGLKRTKGGQRKGRGLAITGLILGLVGLLAWVGLGILAALGVAWFDSVLLPDEAEVGQCIDVDEDDGEVLIYEKECDEEHDGEVVGVVEVDDDNREQISSTMADYCASVIDPEDLVKLSAVEGLEFKAVIEDPNDVKNGDILVCYVEADSKLDEPIL